MIRRPTVILALLTALNLINYLDRYLVMAVAPTIQGELALSDGQIGWVGSAFMIGYFITSPLFGWLGDRYPRKALIAVGVAVWSVATVASGLTHSFYALIGARILVGVGEASYATLSPTIIDDIATAQNRNRWLAIFYVAVPVGSALGFVLGGMLDHRYGWRSAFFIAGGPGLVLALVTLLIAEPTIRRTRGVEAQGLAVYVDLARRPVFRDTIAGYVAQTFALGGFTMWVAPFLLRRFQAPLEVANSSFGTITVITGLGGTALGGYLADRWPGKDRVSASLRLCAWSSIVAAPLALLALLVPGYLAFLAVLGVCELAIFTSVAPTNMVVMRTVPMHLRAQAMAASIFAIHLLGDLLSPPLIGSVADALHDSRLPGSGGHGLQVGMYLLPLAMVISAGFWWRAGTRAAQAQLEELPKADALG